jgi:hypothetical protein
MTIENITVSMTRSEESFVADMLCFKVRVTFPGNVFHYVRYVYEEDLKSHFDTLVKSATETLWERILNPGEPDFITDEKQ